MAKAMVKCLVCGEKFDRLLEPCEKIGRRYAHENCYNNWTEETKTEESYGKKIFELLKEKSNGNYDFLKINRQKKKLLSEGCTNEGIYKSLDYWYNVKNNVYKDTIGIVPYIYKEAERYFLNLETKSRNIERTVTKNQLFKEVNYEFLNNKKSKKEINLNNL